MSLVLIVDGSATNRLHFRLLAEQLGHQTLLVANIDEANRQLSKAQPDLMIINLFEYETQYRHIQAQFADIPVAVVAHPDESACMALAEAKGAISVLFHPIDSSAIEHALSCLGTRVVNSSASPAIPELIPGESSQSGLLHLYANLAHDLRTPLNAILGFSGMLADEVTDLGEPGLALDVKRIHNAGERMLAMVDELVDLARADLGQLTLSPQGFSVREALETLKSEIQTNTSLSSIVVVDQIDANAPQWITTDARRFRQILVTLINVVRHGGEGPVTLYAGRAGDDLKVTLTAPKFGMTANELNQSIGPLDQAEPALLARNGGLCMGLALSHRLLRIMNGTIQFMTEDGITSVQLIIPPGQSTSHHESASARVSSSKPTLEVATRPLKILLAEDSPVNQSLMRSMLKRIGREADLASNGMEVLAMLRKSNYDLILMDVNMPEMDGLEATRKIRAGWPVERRPKIVALTGAINPADIEACHAAGMDDFLAKPIQSPALQAMIERMFV